MSTRIHYMQCITCEHRRNGLFKRQHGPSKAFVDLIINEISHQRYKCIRGEGYAVLDIQDQLFHFNYHVWIKEFRWQKQKHRNLSIFCSAPSNLKIQFCVDFNLENENDTGHKGLEK